MSDIDELISYFTKCEDMALNDRYKKVMRNYLNYLRDLKRMLFSEDEKQCLIEGLCCVINQHGNKTKYEVLLDRLQKSGGSSNEHL
jgi:hypothetical protein